MRTVACAPASTTSPAASVKSATERAARERLVKVSFTGKPKNHAAQRSGQADHSHHLLAAREQQARRVGVRSVGRRTASATTAAAATDFPTALATDFASRASADPVEAAAPPSSDPPETKAAASALGCLFCRGCGVEERVGLPGGDGRSVTLPAGESHTPLASSFQPIEAALSGGGGAGSSSSLAPAKHCKVRGRPVSK